MSGTAADGGLLAHARERLARHPWPEALLALLARLREGGGRALLVGGTVRDVLLGRAGDPVFDVATDRTPPEVIARVGRVVPIGIAHGTVLVIEGEVRVECTTFRREGGYADARRPDRVAFTGDLEGDLARRDLTVNAMAWDPASETLHDPFSGVADLEARVLRAVGDPQARFHEDALRPVRVARLAATLGMEPEPATRAALAIDPGRAGRVAVERVRDELERLMRAERPSTGYRLLREAGLLALWLSELDRCAGVPQNRFHAHDVFVHSLLTCDAAPADRPRVRWAALLHDIGKPDTRVERKGDGTFYGHDRVGAELADGLLERLRFPAGERRAIVHLVREHMFDIGPGWSDAAVRRWLRRVGPESVDDLLALRAADAEATGRPGAGAGLDAVRARVDAVRNAPRALSVRDLAVDGRDVMAVLGLTPGPGVGAALERLLEDVIEDPSRNERAWLLERLAGARDTESRP